MTHPLIIHRCAACGHYEGETPQAGCCPNCGVSFKPIPVAVRPLTELERELHYLRLVEQAARTFCGGEYHKGSLAALKALLDRRDKELAQQDPR